MNIVDRKGSTITFQHLGHTFQVRIEDCAFPEVDGRVDERSLLTPEMVCVREDCPECAKTAEERGLPGYRTPAQTCFPLLGDSEAMEMHLRYRISNGKGPDSAREEMTQLMRTDPAALRRLESIGK